MKFPDALRGAREGAGRSLSQLADGCHLSTKYLSDVERGWRLPPYREVVLAIARVLKANPTTLLAAARSDIIDHALRQLARRTPSLMTDPATTNDNDNDDSKKVSLLRDAGSELEPEYGDGDDDDDVDLGMCGLKMRARGMAVSAIGRTAEDVEQLLASPVGKAFLTELDRAHDVTGAVARRKAGKLRERFQDRSMHKLLTRVVADAEVALTCRLCGARLDKRQDAERGTIVHHQAHCVVVEIRKTLGAFNDEQ